MNWARGKEEQRNVKVVVYGLGLHAAIALTVLLIKPESARIPSFANVSKKYYEPVAIVSKPIVKPKALVSPVEKPSEPQSKAGEPSTKIQSSHASLPPSTAQTEEAASTGEVPEAPGKSRGYSRLLPNASESPITIAPVEERPRYTKNVFASGLSSLQKQDLMRAAGTLVTMLDVPLEDRRDADEGLAHARLRYDEAQQRLSIVTLYGQPLLRAALFERLKEKNAAAIVKELMATLTKKELRIFLHFVTPANAAGQGEENYRWNGDRLDIYKVVTKGGGGGGGLLTLPDAEAEKARRWDHNASVKLRESAAYSRVLENKTLCERC